MIELRVNKKGDHSLAPDMINGYLLSYSAGDPASLTHDSNSSHYISATQKLMPSPKALLHSAAYSPIVSSTWDLATLPTIRPSNSTLKSKGVIMMGETKQTPMDNISKNTGLSIWTKSKNPSISVLYSTEYLQG